MLRIWGRNTSINVQKAMWAVGELKLPHERIDIGGPFGKNNEPAYLTKNPNGLVPTLEEDNGFLLWESNAIVRYLASKYGAGSLEPRSAARSPLRAFRLTDSCGVCMAGVTRSSVITGAAGLLMSSTKTPLL